MSEGDATSSEVRRLRAQVSTLEQLLDVYEQSVLQQSERIDAEQGRLRLQTTLLTSQGEASLDGILSVSTEGRILFANHRFAELWGIEPPRIGENGFEQTRLAMAERCRESDEIGAGGTEFDVDEERRDEIHHADGRIFDRYTAPIRDDEGNVLGRVWQFRDITAIRRVDELKDEFISAVSHELRTPLTSIRGSLDLVTGGVMGELPFEAMSLLKTARGSCDRLSRLIDDVLDIEKIGAGHVVLALEPLDLTRLVERSVESMRSYGLELGVHFAIEISVPGARVRGDADRLVQVMENLLSNAAKWSAAGDAVAVSLTRNGDRFRVAISDRGPGIASEFHDRIFEKFTQIDPPGFANKSGTGLGLNLARANVELHGGTIDFSSEPGVGSTFYFELPVGSSQPTGENAA